MNQNKPLHERLIEEDSVKPENAYTTKSSNLEEKHRKQVWKILYQTWIGWLFVLFLGGIIFFQMGAEYGVPQLIGALLLPLAIVSTGLLLYFERTSVSDYIGLDNRQKLELIELKERSLTHRRWTTLLLWLLLCYFAAKNIVIYMDDRTWNVFIPYTDIVMPSTTVALLNLGFILVIAAFAYFLIRRTSYVSNFQLQGRLIGIEEKLTELLEDKRGEPEQPTNAAHPQLEERIDRLEETIERLRQRIENDSITPGDD